MIAPNRSEFHKYWPGLPLLARLPPIFGQIPATCLAKLGPRSTTSGNIWPVWPDFATIWFKVWPWPDLSEFGSIGADLAPTNGAELVWGSFGAFLRKFLRGGIAPDTSISSICRVFDQYFGCSAVSQVVPARRHRNLDLGEICPIWLEGQIRPGMGGIVGNDRTARISTKFRRCSTDAAWRAVGPQGGETLITPKRPSTNVAGPEGRSTRERCCSSLAPDVGILCRRRFGAPC